MTDQSNRLKRCFQRPSLIAYKRSRNLNDILVRAKVTTGRKSQRKPGGYSLCKRLCKACILGERASTHKCYRTNQEWQITAPINCQTDNVIYKLSCRKCPNFVYIGETCRRFCDRLAEHRGYISQKKLHHPVGFHFNQKGHNVTDLLPIAIERVLPKGDSILRKKRESLWINRYDAVTFGANTRD